MELLWISLGGIFCAVSRFAVAGFFQNLSGETFPWGTFSVNIIGSFLIGFLWGLIDRFAMSPQMRAFAFIGSLGSFTTFSSYSLETINLVRDGEYVAATGNFLINNFGAFFMTIFGLILANYIISR
jgi:CrcB protein